MSSKLCQSTPFSATLSIKYSFNPFASKILIRLSKKSSISSFSIDSIIWKNYCFDPSQNFKWKLISSVFLGKFVWTSCGKSRKEVIKIYGIPKMICLQSKSAAAYLISSSHNWNWALISVYWPRTEFLISTNSFSCKSFTYLFNIQNYLSSGFSCWWINAIWLNLCLMYRNLAIYCFSRSRLRSQTRLKFSSSLLFSNLLVS